MLIGRVAVALCSGDAESTTFTPMLKFPDADGVPLITPLELSTKPDGRELVADHV
jgi:hypothetical protein